MLRAILDLQPSGAQLKANPLLPGEIDYVSVTGIPGRWGQHDVLATAREQIVAEMRSAATDAPPAVRELLQKLEDRLDTSRIHQLSAAVLFDLHESGPWRINLRQGTFHVDHVRDEADCTFDMSDGTLVELLHGKSARSALLSGRLKVRGDAVLAGRAGELLLGTQDE
jgi:putative sterol carrier protein